MSKKSKKKSSRKTKKMKGFQDEILKFLKGFPSEQFSGYEIAERMGVIKPGDVHKLQSTLYSLARDNKLTEVKRGVFRIRLGEEFFFGKVEIVKSGNGFLISDSEDGKEDIFISNRDLGKALQGDKVKVKAFPQKRPGGRRKGKVMDVIERADTQYVGVLDVQGDHAFLRSNKNQPVDFYIADIDPATVKSGMVAVVKLVKWGSSKSPYAKIVELLGKRGEHETDMHAILLEYGFTEKFSEEVLNEADAISETITPEDVEKRRDMRGITTFTIDPLDAKDFDDAISVQRLENGNLEIGVHIADVTHYLKPGTKLDKEAFRRSTTVYLVDRVAPMLPEKLSNGLCSLRPNEDKCCFSAIFELDNNYKIEKEWFGKTLIHSDRRFTYEEAQEVLETKEGDFSDELFLLNKVAKLLKKERFKKGSIAFETVELRFKLDENNKPVELIPKIRQDAHMLVEDFMLLANKRVAAYMSKPDNHPPFIYRVHDNPNEDKLGELRMVAKRFGYDVQISNPTQIVNSLNKLMEEIDGKPEQTILQSMAIRCMSKAVYTSENIGHYGLGFQDYTHFTSPIRRYSDVFCHRLLEEKLEKRKIYNIEKLEEKCIHISAQERKAMEAERSSVKYKQVEFMAQFVGDVFEGMVSGLTEWGFFVEIVENKCEGAIRLSNLEDDMYYYEEEKLRIIGRDNRRSFKFGDRLKIRIKAADLFNKTIDLELVEEDGDND